MNKFKLNEEIIFENQEKIFINTDCDENLLELARKDSELKEKYKELLKNDYILSLHKNKISWFCKREFVYKLFTKEHKFYQYKNILYRIKEPQGRKINDKVQKN
ncbi:hypothetical protein QI179_06000 [Staphylococcus saprophyticus]|nr:hypothetical protein [Staphylococcus saprophyticus]